jgi:hypothetical protein
VAIHKQWTTPFNKWPRSPNTTVPHSPSPCCPVSWITTIQYRFFFSILGNIFYVFLIFFKMNPKYFSLRRSCRLIRVFYRLPCEYAQKMRRLIFCATFRTKLCNTRIKRQNLLREVVDSKMLLFYRSQIGQCSST